MVSAKSRTRRLAIGLDRLASSASFSKFRPRDFNSTHGRPKHNLGIMDKVRAKRFEKELVGQTVSGWNILSFINFGKSALVFRAQRGDRTAAVKFFDPEIIEKHGAEIQIKRIEREKSLIGKKHPNLVEIFDGGHWQERDLYFVVMEYLP